MKVQYYILLFFIFSLGCQKSKIPINENDDFEEYVFPKFIMDFSNSKCQRQLREAEKDYQNGKLVYQFYSEQSDRFRDELKELLSKYEIEYDDKGEYHIDVQECYGWYMDSLISVKFGKDFISGLKEKADSMFLARWETKTYIYWHLDEEPKYSEGYGFSDIFIKNRISFPKSWDTVPMEDQRQYLKIWVTINKKGELEKWEHEYYNLKETNVQFYDHLKNQTDSLLERMVLWEPGVLNGKKVSSEYLIDINLDKKQY
jgi:hypothetical protein